jgi:hypothetical protein
MAAKECKFQFLSEEDVENPALGLDATARGRVLLTVGDNQHVVGPRAWKLWRDILDLLNVKVVEVKPAPLTNSGRGKKAERSRK